MTPTQANAFAERFREAPGWQWMPGMLFTNYSGENGSYDERVLAVVLGAPTIPNQKLLVTSTSYEHGPFPGNLFDTVPDGCCDARDAVPVITDPTTLACILWLITEHHRESRAREVKALRDAISVRFTMDRYGTPEWDAATNAVLRQSGAVAAYYSRAITTIASDGWTYDLYRAALACLEAT